jgi:hypothetical protein
MASGVRGKPDTHDSSTTLTTLLPRIATATGTTSSC